MKKLLVLFFISILLFIILRVYIKNFYLPEFAKKDQINTFEKSLGDSNLLAINLLVNYFDSITNYNGTNNKAYLNSLKIVFENDDFKKVESYDSLIMKIKELGFWDQIYAPIVRFEYRVDEEDSLIQFKIGFLLTSFQMDSISTYIFYLNPKTKYQTKNEIQSIVQAMSKSIFINNSSPFFYSLMVQSSYDKNIDVYFQTAASMNSIPKSQFIEYFIDNNLDAGDYFYKRLLAVTFLIM